MFVNIKELFQENILGKIWVLSKLMAFTYTQSLLSTWEINNWTEKLVASVAGLILFFVQYKNIGEIPHALWLRPPMASQMHKILNNVSQWDRIKRIIPIKIWRTF
jgi:hypothetical protein